MLKCATLPTKIHLNTAMQVKKVWQTADVSSNTYEWRIPNFKALKKNTDYCNRSRELDWIFSITKKASFYLVTIDTGNYGGEMECSVRYSKDDKSSCIIADGDTDGKYRVSIPLKIFSVPENDFLLNDIAVLVFKFNEQCKLSKPILLRPKDLENEDENDLVQDFLPYVGEALYSDFTILVKENKIFPTNKAILASRSDFFRHYIEDNCTDGEPGEITIDTTRKTMNIVELFLRIGHVTIASRRESLEILNLSKKFGLRNLQTLCEEYLRNYINRRREFQILPLSKETD